MNTIVKNKLNQINKGINLLIKNNNDIKSIISVGSFSQGTIDEYSDVDLYIFTDDVKKYIAKDTYWIGSLGNVLARMIHKDPMRKVDKHKIVLDNGLQYDLTIVNVKRLKIFKIYFLLEKYNLLFLLPKFLKNGIETNMIYLYDSIKRGYKIHIDKINLNFIILKIINSFKNSEKTKINKEDFLFIYNHFWHNCYGLAVKLIRDDVYHSYLAYGKTLGTLVLGIIEMEVKSNKDVDVYYDARKFEKWAGVDMQKKVFESLTLFNDKNHLTRLNKTIKFFQDLSHPLAKKYNFPINVEFENFVSNFIETSAMKKASDQEDGSDVEPTINAITQGGAPKVVISEKD